MHRSQEIKGLSLEDHGVDPASSVAVRCWGTRGSIPSPGPETSRYGGNTTCLEFLAGGARLILDAGTGIRRLGQHMTAEGKGREATILLTHYHWDHIQGLPFFAPAYESGYEIKVYGPRLETARSDSPLTCQMDPVHFPVSHDRLPASFSFAEVGPDPWDVDGIRIRTMTMRHPSKTLGYRLEVDDRVLVFVPDNEIEGGPFPVEEGWRDSLERFVEGADALFHDAMFTSEEREPFEGWGHSTFEEVFDLACKGGVKHLFFFHHAPDRTDDALDAIVEDFRSRVRTHGFEMAVDGACEGDLIHI